MMEIKAKHNPDVYLQKCEKVWKIIAQKNERNERQWWIFISVIAVSSIFIIVKGSGFGYVTATVSVFGMFYMLNYRRRMLNARKKYMLEANKISKSFTENIGLLTWRFSENDFIYEDFQMTLKLNWALFSNFEIINDILFLLQCKDIQSSITIAKEEVGEENFLKIVMLVKDKIN